MGASATIPATLGAAVRDRELLDAWKVTRRDNNLALEGQIRKIFLTCSVVPSALLSPASAQEVLTGKAAFGTEPSPERMCEGFWTLPDHLSLEKMDAFSPR